MLQATLVCSQQYKESKKTMEDTIHVLHVRVLSHFSHVQLFASLWAVARQTPLSTDSPGKNTGVGCHCLPLPYDSIVIVA